MADDDALIARMLAEEEEAGASAGYADLVGEDDSADSDWSGGGRARKPKKKRVKTGGRQKAAAAAAADAPTHDDASPAAATGRASTGAASTKPTPPSGEAAGGLTATGRSKRKDTGTKRAEAARGWSDAEKAAFESAIAVHGRDWVAVAGVVGTRDKRAVASHAQKTFIRWAAEGRRLPPAVEAAGGPGYTLSGKPLDPHCASAKAYGLRPERVAELLEAGADLPGVLAPDDPACCVFAQGGPGWVRPAPGEEARPVRAKPKARAPAGPPKEKAPPPPPPRAAASPSPSSSPPPEPAGPPPPRTAYAAARPRRAAAGPAKAALGATTEALDLLPCRDFLGAPGAPGPLSQPYSLSVSRAATAVMDLHAHLCSKEVIGLLGGSWDPDARSLTVTAAFPCRRAPGSLSGTSVELDPEAEVAARSAMSDAGLSPVGWYHSHPIFEPTPSQKDADNQRNYQALFACGAGSGAEPFVGAIVGPYDPALPGPAAKLTWFIVARPPPGAGAGGSGGGAPGCGGGLGGGGRGGGGCGAHGGGLEPFALRHRTGPRADPASPAAAGPGTTTSAPPATTTLTQDLVALAEQCRAEPDAVELKAKWRGFSTRLPDGGGVDGPPLTKAQKAFASLARHLERGPGLKACVEAVAAALGVDGGVALAAAGVLAASEAKEGGGAAAGAAPAAAAAAGAAAEPAGAAVPGPPPASPGVATAG